MDDNKCLKCRKPVQVFGSLWCEVCYYPGIDHDYEEYQQLIEEGHSNMQAAVLSGWKGAEEF